MFSIRQALEGSTKGNEHKSETTTFAIKLNITVHEMSFVPSNVRIPLIFPISTIFPEFNGACNYVVHLLRRHGTLILAKIASNMYTYTYSYMLSLNCVYTYATLRLHEAVC